MLFQIFIKNEVLCEKAWYETVLCDLIIALPAVLRGSRGRGSIILSCHIGRADREYTCKHKVVGSNFIGDIFGTQTETKRRHGGKSTWATS